MSQRKAGRAFHQRRVAGELWLEFEHVGGFLGPRPLLAIGAHRDCHYGGHFCDE